MKKHKISPPPPNLCFVKKALDETGESSCYDYEKKGATQKIHLNTKIKPSVSGPNLGSSNVAVCQS